MEDGIKIEHTGIIVGLLIGIGFSLYECYKLYRKYCKLRDGVYYGIVQLLGEED